MSTTTRPQKTVLVVEDDPWIRSLMADLLAGEGYSVVQASDGKAGLDMAEESDPDVILLDLAMPEKSGLDVLHELKSSKPTRDIPVIVVSAYAMLMMGSDARRAEMLQPTRKRGTAFARGFPPSPKRSGAASSRRASRSTCPARDAARRARAKATRPSRCSSSPT